MAQPVQPINIYQNGKIYKITDIGYNECYIGSTTQKYLSSRLGCHKYGYKKYQSNGGILVSSYKLFDTYGVDNCKIELIESYPCNNINELNSREGYWIKNSQNCINKNVAGRTLQEYMIDNKDKCNQIKRKYFLANKDKIYQHAKTKIQCECGSMISNRNISTHRKNVHK